MMEKVEKIKAISFRQKNATECPVCKSQFFREELFSGSGRLIAGNITNELRRLYEKNNKFGVIYPLAYQITVCDRCLYAAYPKDFSTLLPNEIDVLDNLADNRRSAMQKFFGSINFSHDRDLRLGAASYMLAIDCYSQRNRKIAPTFKNAMSAIRAAWLFDDLSKEEENENSPYGKISMYFYKKAYIFYNTVLEYLTTGAEPSEAAGHMGPDVDKNWGYEGILYLAALLTVKVFADDPDKEKRIAAYEASKKNLSRVFGTGKSSKSKPSDMIERTRELYNQMTASLAEWAAGE